MQAIAVDAGGVRRPWPTPPHTAAIALSNKATETAELQLTACSGCRTMLDAANASRRRGEWNRSDQCGPPLGSRGRLGRRLWTCWSLVVAGPDAARNRGIVTLWRNSDGGSGGSGKALLCPC